MKERFDYFKNIENKYKSKISTNKALVIRLDGRNVCKNKNINILNENKGFASTMKIVAEKISSNYGCIVYVASDEINIIIDNTINIIRKFKSSDTQKISSLISQEVFFYFNKFFKEQLVYFDSRCFSIEKNKIMSYLKYRRNCSINVLTQYFAKLYLDKEKRINLSLKELDEILINEVDEYSKRSKYQREGLAYYLGNKLDIENIDKIMKSQNLIFISNSNIENKRLMKIFINKNYKDKSKNNLIIDTYNNLYLSEDRNVIIDLNSNYYLNMFDNDEELTMNLFLQLFNIYDSDESTDISSKNNKFIHEKSTELLINSIKVIKRLYKENTNMNHLYELVLNENDKGLNIINDFKSNNKTEEDIEIANYFYDEYFNPKKETFLYTVECRLFVDYLLNNKLINKFTLKDKDKLYIKDALEKHKNIVIQYNYRNLTLDEKIMYSTILNSIYTYINNFNIFINGFEYIHIDFERFDFLEYLKKDNKLMLTLDLSRFVKENTSYQDILEKISYEKIYI